MEQTITKLTIFTPTYNRAYTLPKLYESLAGQTNKNFIWLIVDDGSIDETKSLVSEWKKKKLIEIEYIFQSNGGKMRAHNLGVRHCNTDLFMCVDSDDFLKENAVEEILKISDEVLSKKTLSAIVAYKGKNESELIGNTFPKGIKLSSLNDLYRKGFKGDTSLIFKTNILKQYLFPEIDGEKFITEDYVYSQIDEKYKMLLLPEIIIICSYLEDGYTKNALRLIMKNPKGVLMYYNLKIRLAKSIKEKVEFIVRYSAIGKLVKNRGAFSKCNSKLLYILCYPIAMFYYLKKKKIIERVK